MRYTLPDRVVSCVGMSIRLVERFAVGDSVDVAFTAPDGERWVAGRVVAHAHPGVWVRIGDGSRWFVTNGKRIRERPSPDASARSHGGA